jgi:hypothetical protein
MMLIVKWQATLHLKQQMFKSLKVMGAFISQAILKTVLPEDHMQPLRIAL